MKSDRKVVARCEWCPLVFLVVGGIAVIGWVMLVLSNLAE